MDPFIVFWELTRACMLACKHCRAKAIRKRDPNELTREECFRVMDDLASFSRPMLIFTGGDPLMREDLPEIVAHASKKFRVSIAFSGTEKANREVLEELKNAGVARIAISIDGLEETHDKFRGIRGVFRKSLEVLRIAKEVGLPFQINTTVTRDNIFELPEILKLCLKLGAEMWDVFFIVPTGRAKAELMPSAQEFEDILCWLYDVRSLINAKSSAAVHFRRIEIMRSRGEIPEVGELYWKLREKIDFGERKERSESMHRAFVTDGRGMFFISHVGEIYPSGFLQISAGNVREKRVEEIYRNSEIFVKLRDPNNLKGKCGICEFRSICGGSRARAYAITGDYLAEEPCCVYRPRGKNEGKHSPSSL
ncbi:MAG: TIGR04053 family radical SAM/SPASM domain-containing protein [Archaeoglobales archaeon]|nr:TIGR04053 family radical SAM/SPASM domain-containing protein [Archaeoglobales archaeon]